MTSPECAGCPFPDSVAALELVRLREGIGRLADEWEGALSKPLQSDGTDGTEYDRGIRRGYLAAAQQALTEVRALLDDNQGER